MNEPIAIVDRKLVADAMVPSSWMRLRLPLSFGLAVQMLMLGNPA